MGDTKELCAMFLLLALWAPTSGAQTITEIIDGTGDGTHALGGRVQIAVDKAVEGMGNVYVAGSSSDNAFKITPDGTITEIIDSTGDGTHALNGPYGIAVDASRNVYVAGTGSDNAFKITPDGTITEIIDSTGDGVSGLDFSFEIAVDASRNVYVTGMNSNNAFKISPDGTITEIIDGTGDGANSLDGPVGIAVDASGNVYVAGSGSDNAFRITPGGAITEIIDSTGDGVNGLNGPSDMAAEGSGNAYVTGVSSNNAFKITPDGTITEIIDSTGDGANGLGAPFGMAAEGSGIVYVSGLSDNAFRITPEGRALSGVAGLVVPGFEVTVDDPDGPTTFFAARNTTDEEVFGVIDFFGLASTERLRRDAFTLDPQATLSRNVRDNLSELEIEDGVARGLIIITEFDGTTAPNLEGDYFRVDFGNDFASGNRLVRPRDFCLTQEIRFVDFGSGSRLRILLNRPRGDEVPSFSYTAYDQAGTIISSGDVSTSSYLSMFDIGDLVAGQNFGTVLFDFSSSGGGWVSARYSAFGRFSVELDSACRDE